MKINEHALKFIFDDTLYKQSNSFKIEGEDDIKFLGKNNKNILIIVPSNEHILQDDEKAFLEKILNSIGLQLDDCVVTCPKAEAKYTY